MNNAVAAAPITSVPLLDVHRGNSPLRDECLQAIAEVLDSGRFLHGPQVSELEARIANLCDVPFAVGCASGSDALLLALMALDIGCGDEVIMPSFTFFATASAAWRLGAKPVFVDIDPATFNIDPAAVEAAITEKTKAVIPVHLFGQCAEMDQICSIASQHNLRVIEDAAQAIGATYDGRPAGSWGDVGCLSFYPTKNLGGMGDGGMMVAKDAEIAKRLKLFANHGMEPRYYHSVVGINSRLDTMQAAVLGVKLSHLDRYVQQRVENAIRYNYLFEKAGMQEDISIPSVDAKAGHVWNQYSLIVHHGRRDALRAYLTEQGVGSEIYYPVPMHQQVCFAGLVQEQPLPVTEATSKSILHLPIFPELTQAEQERVVCCIRDGLASIKRIAA